MLVVVTVAYLLCLTPELMEAYQIMFFVSTIGFCISFNFPRNSMFGSHVEQSMTCLVLQRSYWMGRACLKFALIQTLCPVSSGVHSHGWLQTR